MILLLTTSLPTSDIEPNVLFVNVVLPLEETPPLILLPVTVLFIEARKLPVIVLLMNVFSTVAPV